LFTFFSVAIVMVAAVALAQTKSGKGSDLNALVPNTPDEFPPSMQATVHVMVELSDAPAAVPYAAALKQAQAQADAQRNYALAHPTLKSSQALLKAKPQAVQISSSAANQVKSVVQRIEQTQRNILPALTGSGIGGQVIYRAQRAYNGIALIVSPDKISAIAALPGVKAVHPLHPKFMTAAFSDIDFLGGRSFWTKPPFGIHGENIKVADLDTGLDYIHVDFGGPGSSGYSVVTDHSSPTSAPNAYFPSAKVPGGIDLVGDAYDGSNVPVPDPDPFDCNGHGTATASLIAGYGATNAGFVYAGSYDASDPMMASLSIAPGFAPNAKLYVVRVFGCAGSTDVVGEAIEWSMDPNGDGNFSDHMDVINMSLGANAGFADDPDDIAASNGASIGIIICSAAGNAGDSYYIHSSPAAAGGTLGCAATFNDQNGYIFDAVVTGNAPPAFAGQQGFSIYTTTSPHTSATADVVYAVNALGASGSTHDGSSALLNAAQMSGKIALVDRTPGNGTNASTNCQNAGAIGIIDVADGIAGGNPFLLTTAGTVVPMVVCPTSYGTAIKTAAAFDANGVSTSSPAVNVTIAPGAGSVVQPANPAGTGAIAGSPDTVPSYTSRGPRLPDSAIKPDVAAPAEVTGVALSGTGNGFENFNGTSSATPHIAGAMALLKQFHPTWTVQELNALICDTATHDLATTVGGSTLIGVGRVGAGRIDLTNASNANVVAYNGTDPNHIGVSFGVVEVPADGSGTLSKNITVTNKGATNVTYNLSIQNNPAVTGATFSFPGGSSFTATAASSTTVPVQLAVTGSALKHVREAAVSATQSNSRQWLTEAGGYAVFTPTDASPTLRVALYGAPKPTSSMHATITGVVPTAPNTGSFTINLSGAPVNTGASLGNGFDVLSLVKAFELQYASTDAGAPGAGTDRNVIKYVGITSDYVTRTPTTATRIVWGIEDFGDAAFPRWTASDREIFVDTGDGFGGPPDGTFDFVVYPNNNGTGQENVFLPAIVKLHAGTAANQGFFTNGLSAATADTNAYNNSAIALMVNASALVDTANGYPALATPGHTFFQYQVVTFDRNGDEVDETPVLSYDLANPGLEVENSGAVAGVSTVFGSASAFVESFWYKDIPTNFIPVNYNGTNFQTLGSLGVMLMHMHNGDGNRTDVVAFRKPTVSGFNPTSGKVGSFVTITGSNFGTGTVVKFGTTVATINVLTSNTLVATVPAVSTGVKVLRVSNAAGSTTAGNFTVTP
jgi:subtilisin family serine protease